MATSELYPRTGAKVLFCTDFSETADHAFLHAVDAVRRRSGSELILLHVIPEPEAQFWKTYIYEVEDVDAKARQDVDAKIAEAYTPHVSAEILDFAKDENVHLIVLGRQGHSALAELVFGTVTDRVLRATTCPVLVVPEAQEEA